MFPKKYMNQKNYPPKKLQKNFRKIPKKNMKTFKNLMYVKWDVEKISVYSHILSYEKFQ